MKSTKKTMKPKMAKGGKMIQTAGNALTKALLGQGYNERPAKMQKGGEMGEKMNKYMNLSVNLTVTKDKTEPKETESKMKKGGKMVKKAALGAMMGPKYPGEKRAKRKAEKAQLKSSAEQIASTLSKKGMSVSDFKKSAKAAGATGKSIRMIKRAMKKDANKFGDYKIEYSGKTAMPENKMAKGGSMDGPKKGKLKTKEKTPTQVARMFKKEGRYPLSDKEYMRLYDEDTPPDSILFHHNRKGNSQGYASTGKNAEFGKKVLSEYDRLYKRKNPKKAPYKNMSITEKARTMRIEPSKAAPVPMPKAKPTMAKGGKMSKFDKLASSVAKSYEKKGKSATAAKKIGAAVAAKVGMDKFGKKKMTAMAVKGKKKK